MLVVSDALSCPTPEVQPTEKPPPAAQSSDRSSDADPASRPYPPTAEGFTAGGTVASRRHRPTTTAMTETLEIDEDRIAKSAARMLSRN